MDKIKEEECVEKEYVLPRSPMKASDVLSKWVADSTPEALALRVNITASSIYRLLSYQYLVPELKWAMSLPKSNPEFLSATDGYQLARIDPKKQLEVWKQAQKIKVTLKREVRIKELGEVHFVGHGRPRIKRGSKSAVKAVPPAPDIASKPTAYSYFVEIIGEIEGKISEVSGMTRVDFHRDLLAMDIDMSKPVREEGQLSELLRTISVLREELSRGRSNGSF